MGQFARGSLAPIALDGVVEMQWTVVGDAPFHEGTWTLTTDGMRGVEVLDGTGGVALTIA